MKDNQPIYEELFALLSRRQEVEAAHSQGMSSLAFAFREAVHKQLGFPEETFLRPVAEGEAVDANASQREPWVRLYEYAEGQMMPATGPVLRTIQADGSLSFAIGVSLSAELDSHPKYHFWAAYSLSMHPSDNEPVLETLSGKSREYRIRNNDFSKVIDDFVSEVKAALDPGTIFSAAKKSECIGFFCSA